MDTHEDIHHQGYQKVHHILYPLYYWPGMDEGIEKWCSACEVCVKAKMRRKHLHSAFNSLSDSHLELPRQHYGFGFYGMPKGEILVIVDLCTRETIFKYVTSRTQENVARIVLNECSPFEAGHGLKARTIAEARLQRPKPQGERDG